MNRSSRRRTGVVVAAVALLLPAAATPAIASNPPDPTLVNLLGCKLFDDGSTVVEAGSDITLRLPAFASGNYGLIRTMVDSATATLDMTPSTGPHQALDVSDTFGITVVSRTFVLARPDNVHLGTLAPGDSVDLLYTLEFSHPLAIVYPPVGPSGDNGPYLTDAEDPVSCRITAVAG